MALSVQIYLQMHRLDKAEQQLKVRRTKCGDDMVMRVSVNGRCSEYVQD